MHISILETMNITAMTNMTNKHNYLTITMLLIFVCGCSIVPGVQPIKSSTSFGGDEVYQDSEGNIINVFQIDEDYFELNSKKNNEEVYKIAPGDVLNVIVWGYPEVFPVVNIPEANPINARTVDNDGNIFFPYIGQMNVESKTVSKVRSEITKGLEDNFNNPQVDVTISRFNEKRKIYVIGEVSTPTTIDLRLEPISLAQAIGTARGTSVTTSNSSDVYVIRLSEDKPLIYRLDLSDPTGFFSHRNFIWRSRILYL